MSQAIFGIDQQWYQSINNQILEKQIKSEPKYWTPNSCTINSIIATIIIIIAATEEVFKLLLSSIVSIAILPDKRIRKNQKVCVCVCECVQIKTIVMSFHLICMLLLAIELCMLCSTLEFQIRGRKNMNSNSRFTTIPHQTNDQTTNQATRRTNTMTLKSRFHTHFFTQFNFDCCR